MPYADFNGSGTLLTRYVSGPGMVNGAVVDELLARTSSGGTSAWYLTDELDSVRDLVSSSGSELDHVVYDSFGNILTESHATSGDRFKFAGMEYDSLTVQYYDRARYFDSAAGTFVTLDPLGFASGSQNLYNYVGNDPTNADDPTGEAAEPMPDGPQEDGQPGGGTAPKPAGGATPGSPPNGQRGGSPVTGKGTYFGDGQKQQINPGQKASEAAQQTAKTLLDKDNATLISGLGKKKSYVAGYPAAFNRSKERLTEWWFDLQNQERALTALQVEAKAAQANSDKATYTSLAAERRAAMAAYRADLKVYYELQRATYGHVIDRRPPVPESALFARPLRLQHVKSNEPIQFSAVGQGGWLAVRDSAHLNLVVCIGLFCRRVGHPISF